MNESTDEEMSLKKGNQARKKKEEMKGESEMKTKGKNA